MDGIEVRLYVDDALALTLTAHNRSDAVYLAGTIITTSKGLSSIELLDGGVPFTSVSQHQDGWVTGAGGHVL